MNNTVKNMLLGVLIAMAIVAGWLLAGNTLLQRSDPQYAMRLPEPVALPEFQLQDSNGNTLTSASLRGRWTLLFFGFTHCPDICPATLQQLALARRQLADDGEPLPDILLISVDPERDTPALLRSYTEHFGEGVDGATGSLEELRKLTGGLGIYFEREESDNENYSVAHSPQVIVVNDQGLYAGLFGAPHSVDRFTSDLPILMR